MGKPTGFLDFERHTVIDRDPAERVGDFDDFHLPLNEEERQKQGSRCMDCGVPFCQSDYGCPVDNLIPEWNDLIYRGKWEEAWKRLMKTNNFPEYTGRICPAPCEHACTLAINEPPVTIKDNERHIIDRAYDEGLMKPEPPKVRTDKRIAVIGSGPAGQAAADQLNKVGHRVTVFERDDRIGGLLMYGIPAMKLEKEVVERRNRILAEEGIEFRTGVNVGVDVSLEELHDEYDAVLIAVGAQKPRAMDVPGADLDGVHYAMEFLNDTIKTQLDTGSLDSLRLSARNKHVIVIGGGDTGADCIGTALRHECKSLYNFAYKDPPPVERPADQPWPLTPNVLKKDYSHVESEAVFGRDPREYNIVTTGFVDDGNGHVKAVRTVRAKWHYEPGETPRMEAIPGTEEEWPADLVLLAMGFVGPEEESFKGYTFDRDRRSNIQTELGDHRTNVEGIFAAGDARRGASLVVWAIKEGRMAAREIDRYLMGETTLT